MKKVSYNQKEVTAYFKDILGEPEFEYDHIPKRRFRLDIAWPGYRIGIEVQGGLWIKGAHSTGAGIIRDMEKRNLSLINGWSVLERQPKELLTEATRQMLKDLVRRRGDA